MTYQALLLLLGLGTCHFFCDYVFSTKSMLAAKAKGTPLHPIIEHALAHAGAMFWVLVLVLGRHMPELAFSLATLQLVTHFIIDVLKGRCNVWFPSVASPANKMHWVLFGFDQFLHFAVIVLMVYLAQKGVDTN